MQSEGRTPSDRLIPGAALPEGLLKQGLAIVEAGTEGHRGLEGQAFELLGPFDVWRPLERAPTEPQEIEGEKRPRPRHHTSAHHPW